MMMNLLHHLNIPTDRLEYVLVENRTLRSAARLAAEHWPAAPVVDNNDEAGLAADASDSDAGDEPTGTDRNS